MNLVIIGRYATPFFWKWTDAEGRESVRTDLNLAELTSGLLEQDTVDIYSLVQLTSEKYTFFSSSQGTFIKKDYTF